MLPLPSLSKTDRRRAALENLPATRVGGKRCFCPAAAIGPARTTVMCVSYAGRRFDAVTIFFFYFCEREKEAMMQLTGVYRKPDRVRHGAEERLRTTRLATSASGEHIEQ